MSELDILADIMHAIVVLYNIRTFMHRFTHCLEIMKSHLVIISKSGILNKRQRKSKGQERIGNQEKLATLGTHGTWQRKRRKKQKTSKMNKAKR